MSRPTERRWPIQAFFDATGWTMKQSRKVSPCSGPEYHLRLSHGVTERVADTLATAAGMHPWSIWPEMADVATTDALEACAGCPDQFMPTHASQRYCCPRCRRAAAMRRQRATNPGLAERQRELRRRYYVENRDYELSYARRRRARDAAA